MRLNEFRQLSVKDQKKEVEKAKRKIVVAYQKLCRLGNWNENASKELKEKRECILWKSNPNLN